ncbi:nucleoporin alm1-like [Scomber scombrus]|uniref:Nucleoporin alm1-like n=1 Tax=Scomber scombrus TaxID=13677 RepID=A0AAV1PA81_SCOSC
MAAVKKQLASKELTWEQERRELLREKQDLKANLCQTKTDIKDTMKNYTGRIAQLDDLRLEMGQKIQQKDKELHSLKVTQDQEVRKLNSEWESRLLKQETVAFNHKHQHEDLENKLHQATLEKTYLIATIKEKKKELMGSLAQLSQKEFAFKKNDSEWKTKYEALEVRLNIEVAEKMVISEKAQELQKDHLKKKKEFMGTLAKLSQKEIAFKKNDSEWKTKYEALEDRLNIEVAEKASSSEKAQELQKEHTTNKR